MKTKATIRTIIGVVLCSIPFRPMLKAQTYCSPPPFSSGPYTGITNVKLGTLSSITAYSEGVRYFSSIAAPKLPRNSNQEVRVTTLHDIQGIGFSDKLSVRVWIDWNQDGDFIDADEEVLKQEMADPGLTKQQFKVPNNAKLGKTRMRVYNDMPPVDGHDPATPCGYLGSPNIGLGQHGEVEDYNVEVTATSSINDGSFYIDELSVFPNPANGYANIELTLNGEIGLDITITDIQGKTLNTIFQGKAIQGKHSFSFDTDGLSSGMYLIKVSTSEFSNISKFIIAN